MGFSSVHRDWFWHGHVATSDWRDTKKSGKISYSQDSKEDPPADVFLLLSLLSLPLLSMTIDKRPLDLVTLKYVN